MNFLTNELNNTINTITNESSLNIRPFITVDSLKNNFLHFLLYGNEDEKIKTILTMTQGSLNLSVDIVEYDDDKGLTKIDTLPPIFNINNINVNKINNAIIEKELSKKTLNQSNKFDNVLKDLNNQVLINNLSNLWWPILYKYVNNNLTATNVTDNIDDLIER